MTTEFDQLRAFLKEMFQFEDHDLDFGIYRNCLRRQGDKMEGGGAGLLVFFPPFILAKGIRQS